MEQRYYDQDKDFNAEEWKESTGKCIQVMKTVRENQLKMERKLFEKYFPGDSWNEYEAKIKEAEKKFSPDRKYFNDELQNMFVEMWYINEKTEAASKRA